MLAFKLAKSPETWIMASFVGIMIAPTFLYNIPIGLTMLQKDDHPYLALGVNFQPTLIVPLFLGQLCGGLIEILIADKVSVPQALRIHLEREAKTAKEVKEAKALVG